MLTLIKTTVLLLAVSAASVNACYTYQVVVQTGTLFTPATGSLNLTVYFKNYEASNDFCILK